VRGGERKVGGSDEAHVILLNIRTPQGCGWRHMTAHGNVCTTGRAGHRKRLRLCSLMGYLAMRVPALLRCIKLACHVLAPMWWQAAALLWRLRRDTARAPSDQR